MPNRSYVVRTSDFPFVIVHLTENPLNFHLVVQIKNIAWGQGSWEAEGKDLLRPSAPLLLRTASSAGVVKDDAQSVTRSSGDGARSVTHIGLIVSPATGDWPPGVCEDYHLALPGNDGVAPRLAPGPLFHEQKFPACVVVIRTA